MMVKFGKRISLNYKVISRRAIGASHKKRGVINQDNYKVKNEEITIIAVADGHGNERCKYSHIGSYISVQSFCDVISTAYVEHPTPTDFKEYLSLGKSNLLPRNIVKSWQQAVEIDFKTKRERRNLKFYDSAIYELYGTTLLGLVLFDSYYFAVQLGDGDIIKLFEDGCSKHVNNNIPKILGVETYSMSSKNAMNQFEFTLGNIFDDEKPIAGYLLSTDGLANSFKNIDGFYELGKDYLNLIRNHGTEYVEKRMGNYLYQTSVHGSGDDITLVIAIKQE